jgi:hypothetical protein
LSVEELLPQDHVPKLLQELSDLISGQDNSDCDSFESLDDATKQSGDFEMQSLKRKADLHVEIAPTPPESDSEEVLVYPTPALSVQGSPEKPLTKRQKTDKESFQYIISSLDRHADSQVLLKKGNTPIPIFKKIIQKSMNLEYVELEELEKDVDKMLNTLARQGHVVDRVRKHYEYLVSYYFPSAVVQGKRNR